MIAFGCIMPTRLPTPDRHRHVKKFERRRPPAPSVAEVILRLAIGRDGVGIELAHPAHLACVRITDVASTLPDIRFPVDVSGGVARFRHRRGALARLEIEIAVRSLERWAAPKLRGVVATRTPDVWIAARPSKAIVCVSAATDADDDATQAVPVVAFDVHALAEGADLVLVVSNARGADLPAPATAIAIACVEAVLGRVAERTGAVFALRRVATAVTRALLPEAGARVPATDAVPWCAIAAHGDTWILSARRGVLATAPTHEGLRAREAAVLLAEADDAVVRGDLSRARSAYLDVLERAPRHGEIARRIVDIDALVEGRSEAALATLGEATSFEGAVGSGVTLGALLARIGDVDASMASLERAAETEPAPALAARAFELAARTARDPEAAARWLDRALARAPRATTARWARAQARLTLGRLEDALADVEHLEALASGTRSKHAVWLRAARAWLTAGLGARSGPLFERALRFSPEEPMALAGLGAALVAQGHLARGASVLEHALDLARARDEPTSSIAVELARALAERLDDLPTAIAHASSIPSDAPEAPLARGLEGRWRTQLGDLVGAGLAFARLREMLARPTSPADKVPDGVVDLLLEAADMERTKRHDPLAAQRHLAVALRLRPGHHGALEAYRHVGAQIAGRDQDLSLAPPQARRTIVDLAADTEPPLSDDQIERAARVEELTRRLHGDSGDDAVADELASLLESLGRSHELVALLSGRLEDASPERRAVLAPHAYAALARMAEKADADGRTGDATLYRDAIALLSSRDSLP
jgi:tetratricopeptide (TPR) repeat protein